MAKKMDVVLSKTRMIFFCLSVGSFALVQTLIDIEISLVKRSEVYS